MFFSIPLPYIIDIYRFYFEKYMPRYLLNYRAHSHFSGTSDNPLISLNHHPLVQNEIS